MSVLAVIPARYDASRFPGKPLARQTGKFLVQHVCEQVRAARRIQRCVVATDDERIVAAVKSFGGQAILTRRDHPSGTDRVAEAARTLGGDAQDIVLNVQGDEPEIEPSYLDRLVQRLIEDEACPAATLACPFGPDDDPADPNCVKVVRNRHGRALYFSRALIPYVQDGPAAAGLGRPLLHIGVYGYRRGFLLELAGWEPSPLERIEKLEQLRVLENGYVMAVALVERGFVGIDTPQEYEAFVRRQQALDQTE